MEIDMIIVNMGGASGVNGMQDTGMSSESADQGPDMQQMLALLRFLLEYIQENSEKGEEPGSSPVGKKGGGECVASKHGEETEDVYDIAESLGYNGPEDPDKLAAFLADLFKMDLDESLATGQLTPEDSSASSLPA